MFIDEKGKLFGKVSIIDVIAVIVILGVGAVVGMKYIIPAGSGTVTKPQSFEHVIKIRGVRTFTIDAFEKTRAERGLAQDARTREELCEVVAVEYVQAMRSDVLMDGTYEEFEIPDRFDVFVTLRVDGGKANDTGYYTFQNREITVGSGIRVQTKYAASTGEIWAIREIN